MFDKFLISKKELGKFKISLKNPLGLTCEKVTQTPRAFTTAQIRSAIENILLINNDGKEMSELLVRVTEYTLKDFFLHLHQRGLYNRQFKFWRTLGNIRSASIFKLEKRFFKKEELNCYVIDFFIDEQAPCIKAIVQETTTDYKNFQFYLSWALHFNNLNRLKGVICFIKGELKEDFIIEELNYLTNAFDPISKYESIIRDTSDVRLNVINYDKEAAQFSFKHFYPELKVKSEELKVTNARK